MGIVLVDNLSLHFVEIYKDRKSYLRQMLQTLKVSINFLLLTMNHDDKK